MPGVPFPPSPGAAPRYKTVLGIDVAANTEILDAVPAGKWWWLISATVSCVQGATQTPQPTLILTDGTNNIFSSIGSTTAQSVSTTVQYSWGIGVPLSGLIGATPNIVTTAPLGEFILLPPGGQIKTLTAGIGANTNYGAPAYLVCEFTL
jgi:hypothetical protein